jgi:hypothetical protein
MAFPLVERKWLRIKAFSGRKASGFIHEECFNTRIGNSALWILFPIAGCNPVAFIKWGGRQVVQFHQDPPNLAS